MIRDFIWRIYQRHCVTLHNADFEVCADWRCRLAYALERLIRLQEHP